MVKRERMTGTQRAKQYTTRTRGGGYSGESGGLRHGFGQHQPKEVDTKTSTWSATRLAESRAKAEAHLASRTPEQNQALARAAEIYKSQGTTTEITGKERKITPNASPLELRRASQLIERANRNAA